MSLVFSLTERKKKGFEVYSDNFAINLISTLKERKKTFAKSKINNNNNIVG